MRSKETFEITSGLNIVSLSKKKTNCRSLKILNVRYTTASANQLFMMIKFQGWDDHTLTKGGNQYRYTKLIMMPNTTSSQILYENNSPDPDVIKGNNYNDISNFTLEVFVGTSSTVEYTTDINSSNPIYIEFEIEHEE